MKIIFLISILCLACSSCSRRRDSMSAIRTKIDRFKSFWDDEGDAALASRGLYGLQEDFIPLQEEDLYGALIDNACSLPFEEPGAPESTIPGLEQFRDAIADLAKVFQSVYFNTDDYLLRKPEFTATIDRIAAYLKEHTNTYISVAGHCDERGSESYNLALGTKRSNYIRSLLIHRGVDPNRIYSVSYGKERPADTAHTPDAWAKNRRVEFKIYQKE